MILTGHEIIRAQADGQISIQPFSPLNVNPNSYNYHLGTDLICMRHEGNGESRNHVRISEKGYLLEPSNLYLGVTRERIGSATYAMTLLGRSSIGRLGIFLNASADLGHVGSNSHWTLEISVVQPVYIYPLMRIGQVAFWVTEGICEPYSGLYHRDVRPEPSKDSLLGWQPSNKERVSDPVG